MTILISCTALGFRAGDDIALRLNGLKEIRRMMLLLKGEIRFAGTPLEEAFAEMSGRMEQPLKGFLTEMACDLAQKEGKPLAEIWQKRGEKLKKELQLTQSDMIKFLKVGERLGYLDAKMQMKTIEIYLEDMEEDCRLAAEEYEKKGKLCRCLGLMCGLLLTVIFL